MRRKKVDIRCLQRCERLVVLVNGGPDSAGGVRARQLFCAAECDVLYLYRTRGRLRGLATFLRRGLRFRPTTVYVMDIALAGVFGAAAIRAAQRTRVVVDTGDATTALARSTGRAGLALLAVMVTERLAHRMAHVLVVRGRYHRLYLRDAGVRTRIIQVPDLPPPGIEPIVTPATERANLTVGIVGSLVWSPLHRRCYGWDLLDALSKLPDLPVRAVIIGAGDGLPRLRQRANELGVSNRVLFTGAVPSTRLGEHLSAIDICLSTQTDDLAGWVRTTGKLPLYLAAQRFVLATDVGEASWILPPEMLISYTGSIDRGYPDRLAQRLREIHASPEVLELRSIGPTLVRRHFDVDANSRRLLTELKVVTR